MYKHAQGLHSSVAVQEPVYEDRTLILACIFATEKCNDSQAEGEEMVHFLTCKGTDTKN